MSEYTKALGANLRRARNQNHMSLRTMEELTEGQFKASILGAYERGERSVSVERFHVLCFLYRTKPEELLPPSPTQPFAPNHRHRWIEHRSGQGVICADCTASWGVEE